MSHWRGALHGNIRLVPTAPDQGELEMVVRTRDGETRIPSLGELIANLERIVLPQERKTSNPEFQAEIYITLLCKMACVKTSFFCSH